MPVTVSSAPATEGAGGPPDQPATDPGPATSDQAGAGYPLPVGLALALVIGAMVALMYASHRSGHWWGDDWALYLRQANSLLDGDPGRVAAQNTFSVEHSVGPPFSPPLYPWGFPFLLAPFVAVLGDDLDRLAIVPVLSAVVFSLCWFDLVRRRLGTPAGFAALLAVPISPLLLGWTELIQSEWPFMAVTALTLVALDRLVAADRLVGPGARLTELCLLGVGAAASFSVRREGLAIVAAIAVAQLVAIAAPRIGGRRTTDRARIPVARLVTPHAVAVVIVASIQLLLPSTLVPRYDGTSVANVWRLSREHIEHLADVVGLKRPSELDPVVLGSVALGWIVVAAFLAAGLVGLLLAFTVRYRADAHLAAYAVVAFVIGASFRVAINRYVCTVAPILLLLGLVATKLGIEYLGRRSSWSSRAATSTVIVALLAIGLGNLADARVRVDRATEWREAGRVEWGPTHPRALEMFEAVRRLSEPDDVVAAPKARAMVLETGRWAIQVDDARPVPDDVELALIVVETSSDLMAELDGSTLLWRNDSFAVFGPPGQRSSSASASTNGVGSSSIASP
jgi:hypothetical protein